MLVIVDQHAADERRRLEAMEGDVANFMTVAPLSPPAKVHLTTLEDAALERFAPHLKKWGFAFAQREPQEVELHQVYSPLGVSCGERVRMVCTLQCAVCTCVVCYLRCWNDNHYVLQVPVVVGTPLTPEDFIEFIIHLRTRDASSVPAQDLQEGLRPPAVGRLLASKSCRYAIMFGDPLTYDQCASLIAGLGTHYASCFHLSLWEKVHASSTKSKEINIGKCKVPFNCAHGQMILCLSAHFSFLLLLSPLLIVFPLMPFLAKRNVQDAQA